MAPTPTPLVTPVAPTNGAQRQPVTDDLLEALDPATFDLDARNLTILRSIALLISDETPTATMRDVAAGCEMAVGGALCERLAKLRDMRLVTWRDGASRTLQLTDAGWNRLGWMSPRQQIWHDGFLAGQAVPDATRSEFDPE